MILILFVVILLLYISHNLLGRGDSAVVHYLCAHRGDDSESREQLPVGRQLHYAGCAANHLELSGHSAGHRSDYCGFQFSGTWMILVLTEGRIHSVTVSFIFFRRRKPRC